MNLLELNPRKLLTALLILTHPIGIESLDRTVIVTLFPVALLTPASMTFETPVILENLSVRISVPRFAAVLSMMSALSHVLGHLSLRTPPTPLSLPTRPPPPRSSLVALMRSILVPSVPEVVIVLHIIVFGLVFLVLLTTLILVWPVYLPSRLFVVVSKALVFVTIIPPFRLPSPFVSPLIAAAPFILPILTISIIDPLPLNSQVALLIPTRLPTSLTKSLPYLVGLPTRRLPIPSRRLLTTPLAVSILRLFTTRTLLSLLQKLLLTRENLSKSELTFEITPLSAPASFEMSSPKKFGPPLPLLTLISYKQNPIALDYLSQDPSK